MQDASQQPGWTFKPESSNNANDAGRLQADHTKLQAVTWTASEFVAHEKGGGWYVQVGLASAVLIGLVYFVSRDIFSVIVLLLFAIGFMVFAGRKPQALTYSLSDGDIQIGQKHFPLANFKSFAVVDEGDAQSISLLPLKRFMPALSIYFAPQDENKIVDFLSQHLPEEEHKQDAVDRLMRRIRF